MGKAAQAALPRCLARLLLLLLLLSARPRGALPRMPTADWGRCMAAPADFVDTGDMFSMATMGERDYYFVTPQPVITPDLRPPWDRISNTTRAIVGAPQPTPGLHHQLAGPVRIRSARRCCTLIRTAGAWSAGGANPRAAAAAAAGG